MDVRSCVLDLGIRDRTDSEWHLVVQSKALKFRASRQIRVSGSALMKRQSEILNNTYGFLKAGDISS